MDRKSAQADITAWNGAKRDDGMLARVRCFDWSKTPLGPRSGWPRSLETAVGICLNCQLPMFVWWGPQLINIHNDAYASVLGERHPDALGKPAREIWADIWPSIGADVDDVLHRGVPVVRERVRLVMQRNGYPEETFFTYSHSPIPDDDGGIGGIFQVCSDETAKVHADAEARTILKSISDAFFSVDRQWRFRYVNPQAERLLDRKPGDLIGKVIWEEYPGLIGSPFEAAHRRAAAEGIPSSVVSYYPDHDRWYDVSSYPAPDGGISIYFRDVTHSHRAEEALLESTNLLKGISDSTGDAIFAKDRQGNLRFANPATLSLIGKPLEQVIGRTDAEFLADPEVARAVMENDRRIMESGVAEDVEEVVPLPDGTRRVWMSRKMPNRDASGAVVGLMGVSRDITDQKATADRIDRLYRVAAALAEAITCDQVARVTVEQGIAAAGATAGSLALLSEDGRTLEMHGSIGYPPELIQKWMRFPLDAPIPLAQAVLGGEPVYINSPRERAERFPAIVSLNAMKETRSSACMPMTIGGRTVGALGLSFDRAGEFSAADREFMISLSRQCAQALERARLFEGERDARAAAERAETEVRGIAQRFEAHSRLFERIASATPDFLYVFDLNGRFLYANRRLLEVWGTTFDQAIGKSLPELGYPQWHVEMHMRELEEVIKTKKPIRGEVPFTGGSGISGFYEYIFTPVLGPDGEVEVIAGSTRDVTQRRDFENRLARDATLLANVRDAVIVTDLNGVITFWNDGATRIFGWNAQEMLNRQYVDRLPDAARLATKEWIEKIARGETEFSGEWLDYRRDLSQVWIEATVRQITDSSGKPSGIMGVSREITERKQAEAEREALLASERAARADAERASQMKDEFLATLSHELRTPLNAILGWAAILTDAAPDAQDLREGLGVIERNARAQTQIIEDLLDMSRIISGKVRLEVQRVEIAPILQTAVDSMRPAAQAKGVRLRTIIDPSTGAVSGDSGRLQQIFWNLLSNSVKFTPRGGQVQVLLQRVNSHLEIVVADTGEGIAPDFLPHVFDRFRQADGSTTRRHGGLGLGLAIVKQLVELHGGTISAKSPGPAAGSTFTVVLPLAVIHADSNEEMLHRRHPAAASGAPAASPLCPSLDGVSVLVVDDETDARLLLKRLLETCGATVRVASSAEEALHLVAAERPGVLVSDIGMPGEDGYELIRKIRALEARDSPMHANEMPAHPIPAVALTAYARSEDRVRAMLAGFQTHIAKPVEPIELITVVATLHARSVG